MSDFWVFGYGSLIWNPGFEVVEAQPARLFGLHRSLCIYSWVHRGTQQSPGLVLGLDKGGSCSGMAFRVHQSNRDSVIEYLRGRELVTNVYKESWRHIKFNSGCRERALTFIVDRSSPQYTGLLSLEKQIEIVSRANGNSGPNDEYVLRTVEHLKSIDISDHNLESIADIIVRGQ